MKRAIFLVVILCGPAPALCDAWPSEVLDAAAAYAAGHFDEARDRYESAVLAGETRPEVVFNLGAARYRAAEADSAGLAAALADFRRAAAGGAEELRANALYNGSNMRALLGDLEGAIDGYKDVLRRNPADDDARYNLELLQRLMKQRQQQEQSGDQGEERNEEQKNERQESEDQEQEQQDASEEEQPDQGEGQEEPEPEQGDEPQGQDQPDESSRGEQPEPAPQDRSSISPEEALRQLDKLEEAERELLRQLLLQRQRRIDVEKDW